MQTVDSVVSKHHGRCKLGERRRPVPAIHVSLQPCKMAIVLFLYQALSSEPGSSKESCFPFGFFTGRPLHFLLVAYKVFVSQRHLNTKPYYFFFGGGNVSILELRKRSLLCW